MKVIEVNSPHYIFKSKSDATCITTNGFVKKDGRCVMGAGNAKIARDLIKDLDLTLGKKILYGGNVVHELCEYNNKTIVSFPVKPAAGLKENLLTRLSNIKPNYKGEVPGWACKAELDLIKRSALDLKKLTTMRMWSRVLLPAPGVGNGGLNWKEVEEVLNLDGRFIVVFLRR